MEAPAAGRSIVRSIVQGLARYGRIAAIRAAAMVDSLTHMQRGIVFMLLLGLLAAQFAGVVYLARAGGGDGPALEAADPRGVAALVPGAYAIVSFKPDADAGMVAAHLEQQGVEVVEGPKAGIWRVRLSRVPLDAAAVLARLDALKGDGRIVIFAAPAL